MNEWICTSWIILASVTPSDWFLTYMFSTQTYGIYLCNLLPGGTVVKNLPASAGDTGSIPGLGRSPGEGNGNPHQYSSLENPMDRGTWQAIVQGVTNSDTTEQLSMQTTKAALLSSSISQKIYFDLFLKCNWKWLRNLKSSFPGETLLWGWAGSEHHSFLYHNLTCLRCLCLLTILQLGLKFILSKKKKAKKQNQTNFCSCFLSIICYHFTICLEKWECFL